MKWQVLLLLMLALVACTAVQTPTGNVIVDTSRASSLPVANISETLNSSTPIVTISPVTNLSENTSKQTTSKNITTKQDTSVQILHMTVTDYGYEPSELYAHAGRPIRIVVNGDQVTSCTEQLVSTRLNLNVKLAAGDNIIELPPLQNGTYGFNCGMKMTFGTLNIY